MTTEPDNLRERAARPNPPDEELERALSGQDPSQADEYWRQVAMSTFLLGRHGKLPERADLWSRVQKEIDPTQTATPRRLMRVAAPRAGSSSRAPLWIAAAAAIGIAMIFVIFSGDTPQGPVRKIAVQAPAPPPIPAPVVPAPVERKPETPPPAPLPAPIETPKPVPPAPKPIVPDPAPAPKPEEPKPAPPIPAPPPAKPTEATVIAAMLIKLEGEVELLTDAGKSPVKAGEKIPAGRGLSTGDGKSAAVLTFTDGTRLELSPQTVIRDLFEATAPDQGKPFDPAQGKRVYVERGTVTAEIKRQPQGQNMVFRTPDAEARVLGTTLKLTVPPSGPTRLDVKEGKVKFTRLSDVKSVDVVAGQFTVASAGVELVAKPIAPPRPVLLLSENFEDTRGVDARWKRTPGASPVKTAGRLEIDLTPRQGAGDEKGWGGAGLITRQPLAAPFAVSVDVEIPELSVGLVTTVTFLPPGQKRGDADVFRIQLRDNRYGLWVESGEARELVGADRNGGKSCSERWRIEIDGAQVTFFAGEKEILRHRHALKVAAGYFLELDGSARFDAPTGSRTAFDNVVVEKLR